MKDRIKQVRKQSKMNQTEFGQKIGATQAMLTSYETGRVVPSDTTLKLISKEFDVSYAWLKTGEGPMIDPAAALSDSAKKKEVFQKVEDRLISLMEILIETDPEWDKTLDAAFDELKRRKKGRE